MVYIHIGVGFSVVCFNFTGNARASMRGTDNNGSRFFYVRIVHHAAQSWAAQDFTKCLYQQIWSYPERPTPIPATELHPMPSPKQKLQTPSRSQVHKQGCPPKTPFSQILLTKNHSSFPKTVPLGQMRRAQSRVGEYLPHTTRLSL